MKLRILLVLALCAIILVAGTACKAGSSYNGMTAEQVMQNMKTAELNMTSSHIEATETISGTMQEPGSSNKATMSMVMDITGDVDLQNKGMYMISVIKMDMSENGQPESQTMTMQMYMLDSWMYMGTDMMGKMTWMKTKLTDELWEQQQSSLMQYEELLKNTIEVNVIGEETVNGVACWKLDIKPDMGKILDWYQTAMSDELGDLPDDMDFSKMFKDVKLKMWIAKDTFYTIKCDMTMSMEIEGSVMAISMTADYSKFNQPVTITLPAAAASATEISSYY
jgi:hypothetical protein